MEYRVNIPFETGTIEKYRAGDILYLTGTMYTARDAAHKRMFESGEIPFDAEGAVVYYLGPTPARPGQIIGSAGPTTSGRMDKYTPMLLERGMKGMIGKGRRSEEVRAAIAANHAIYMGATGGAGALLSKCIKSAEVVAYEDLGTEAVRRLYVEDFPVTVLIDSLGTEFRPDK